MRLALAYLMLMAVPMAICYWVMVHALVSFWRRLGLSLAYPVMVLVLFTLVLGIFTSRNRLLVGDYGPNQFLILLAGLLILTGIWLFILVKRQITPGTFIGLPELDPQGHPAKLITTGIYSRMRHPRYTQVLVMIFSCSLLVNCLSIYGLCLASFPAFYFVAWLEERELVNRFGLEYLEYRKRVPMFIPRP
jgi:protein-S-isoprenylcysteine O-methyltransferase Ste14